MTKDEFLQKTYKIIKENVIDELEETKSNTKFDSETKNELIEDYSEVLEIVTDLIPKITSVDSLYELEEDEFSFAVELLENYAEVFIIDGRNEEKLKQDEEEYAILQDILFELYDEFDDEDYEDEDEEE